MKTGFFITVLILLFCMASCQSTPDETIIISKNDGKLEQAIYGSPAPLGKYEAPKTWQEEIDTSKSSDKLLKISVDAKITIPDVEAYPVYRVTPKDITEDDAKAFIKAVTGKEELYSVNTWRTKDVVMSEILEEQSFLDEQNKLTQEQVDYNLDYEIKSAKAKIAELQEEYKAAPDEKGKKLTEIKFNIIERGGYKINEISGVTADTRSSIYISKDNSSGYGSAIDQRKYYLRDYHNANNEYWRPNVNDVYISTKHDELMGIKKSYKEALKEANEYVYNVLGYTDYEMSAAGSTVYIPQKYTDVEWYIKMKKNNSDCPARYTFYYTKVVSGIPIYFYQHSQVETQAAVSPLWPQNYIQIGIDDKGVYSVNENSSIQISELLCENVRLLSFEKIQELFREYIVLKADYNTDHIYSDSYNEQNYDVRDNPIEVKLTVNDVRLGYLRVKEKNAVSTQGIIIPVWMFYGQQVNQYDSSESSIWHLDESNRYVFDREIGKCYLCINAIDGSIIDLTQGY